MQKEHFCLRTEVVDAEPVTMLKMLRLEQSLSSPEFQDWPFYLRAFDLHPPTLIPFLPPLPGPGLIIPSIVHTDKDQNFMDLSPCQSLSE